MADQNQAHSVVLVDDEVLMARTAVRKYLQKLRNNYRNDLRRHRRDHFSATSLRRFDDYLDLYERLGGDPEEVRDPETSDMPTSPGAPS